MKTDFMTPEAITLLDILGDARVVGGCVRDAVMGNTPKDIDIATPLIPDEVIAILKRHGIRTIETGLQHGTITAMMNGVGYEITTLRSDDITDGRHAEVSFVTSWQKDAERRDFTMNAMSMDINGVLYDYFGGMNDIHQNHIRFVGDATKRIQEDYLRILRFFRFSARFNLTPDHTSFGAIMSNWSGLRQISAERIYSEMMGIMSTENPIPVLKEMEQSGVSNIFSDKEYVWNFGLIESLINIQKEKQLGPDPLMRIFMLLYSTQRPASDLMRDKLRLSNDEYVRLNYIDQLALTPIAEQGFTRNNIHGFIYWNGHQAVKDCWVMTRVFSCHTDAFTLDSDLFWWVLTSWRKPKFPVDGEDLKSMGIKQGKEMGQILRNAENWWVENHFTTRDAVLDVMPFFIREVTGV